MRKLGRNVVLLGTVSFFADGPIWVDVETVRDDLASPEVGACIVAAMRGWRTPMRPSAPIRVEFPFVFAGVR